MTIDVVDGVVEYIPERVIGDITEVHPGIICGVVKRDSRCYGAYELSTGMRVGNHAKSLTAVYDWLEHERNVKDQDTWQCAINRKFDSVACSHS